MKSGSHSKSLDSNCPVCNSKENTIVAEYNSNDPLKHLSISPLNDGYKLIKDQIIERWEGNICSFVECSNCTLDFAIPFVAGTKELYSLFYNAPEKGGSINWEHILAKNLIIKKFGIKNLADKHVLEFGAGDGAFVKSIAKIGFEPKNITCTESSENCIKALNDAGVKCLHNELSLLNTAEYENKFNIIVLFQVLEHLDKIDDVFKTINHISTKNSSLLIAVPNNIIRRYYEKNGIFLDVPPVHISRWNKQSFNFIAKKYGWRIKDYEIEKISFFSSAYNFLWNKSLSKSVGGIKKRFIRKPLIAFLLIPLFIINIFKILKIESNANGISQLVHLEKK